MYLLTISLLVPDNNWFKVVEWCQKVKIICRENVMKKDVKKYEEK